MNRREMLQLAAGAAYSGYNASLLADPAAHTTSSVEQWDLYEIALPGPATGNPFTEVQLAAQFSIGHRTVEASGFYDGNGTYRIRFMPDTPGHWTWTTTSNTAALQRHTGTFTCTPATADNHGPVNTAHQFHFQHADGTPFFPFGTTCYSCAFMAAPFPEQTLQTLSTKGFNKVRLCLLPKPQTQPQTLLPFERSVGGQNDLTRLNPAYFQHVEKMIAALRGMGIQADVILFHPYDEWGYKDMPPEANDLYLRYAIARLAAYRNVWWSVANEFDLVKSKTMKDWDHYFRVIQQDDPYSHLRSIHHSHVHYDNSKPWVTHASLQEYDFSKAAEYRQAWGKPIIWDEIQYEGNIARRWGNLSPEEMTRRFWLAVVSGTYATHGETYISPKGMPMSADGGAMKGTSPARIAYLRSWLQKITQTGLTEFDGSYYLSAGKPNELYLYYFDMHCVGEYDFPLPHDVQFRCTLIDPWEMTATELPGVFSTKSQGGIPFSSKPYQAVLFQKI